MVFRGNILKNIVAVVLALTVMVPMGLSGAVTAFADESSSETSAVEESTDGESSEVSDESSDSSAESTASSASSAASNYTIPSASSDFYVYDEVNAISDSTKETIVQTGEYLNAQYGAQIVVAVFNTLGDYNIESFTNDLLTTWKVGGDSGYGLVFLMDVSEDDYYCISGVGLKQLYTSSKIQTILDDNIESVFAQKNYDAAALAFVNACTSDLEKYMQDLAASGVVLVKNSNTGSTTSTASTDTTDAQADGGESSVAATTKKSSGFLGFLKTLVIIILVLVIILCIGFVLVYMHGQKVKRERAEARRRNAQRRSGSSRSSSSQRTSSSQRSSGSSPRGTGSSRNSYSSSSRQSRTGTTRGSTAVNRSRDSRDSRSRSSSSSSRNDYRNR